jgi:hypothetical protein
MKRLILIISMLVTMSALADGLEPIINDVLTVEDFSMLDALLITPVTAVETYKPTLAAQIGVLSDKEWPNCPLQQVTYNCVAKSPSTFGVGYSSSKFEAALEALVNCDLDTPSNQDCKIIECL